MMVVKHLLSYLQGTKHLGITITPSDYRSITCYTNADWASCPDDRRSTSGFCTFLSTNLISWHSSKQKVVPRSSAKSEYGGLSNVAAEISWVIINPIELGVSTSAPPMLLCDNISATWYAQVHTLSNKII